MRTQKRPSSVSISSIKGITYEPHSHRQLKTNFCQIHFSAGALAESADIEHFVAVKSSRPQSALSMRQPKYNSSSMMEKQTNDTRFVDSRTTPRYIKKDKEDMYQEYLQLQIKCNEIQNENTRMKTTIASQSKEIERLSEIIENVEVFMSKKTGHLTWYHLKSRIKELKAELQLKEEELKSCKYSQKNTKTEELRIELKESLTETLRLRTLVDQLARAQVMHNFNDMTLAEEKLYIHGQMLNQLKTENDQLTGLIIITEDETLHYKQLLTETLKTVRRYEEAIDDLHKGLKGKSQYMDKLAQKIESLNNVNSNLTTKIVKIDDFQTKINSLKNTNNGLQKTISEIQSDNEYLHGLVHELKLKLAEKTLFEQKEKKLFEEQVAKLQLQYDIVDDKYKHLLKNIDYKKKDQVTSNTYRREFTNQNISKYENNQVVYQFQPPTYVPKKLRAVRILDVANLGDELNHRFRLKRISISDVIEQYLFDDQDKKSQMVSLKALASRFEQFPFLLTDPDKAMLLARYLIEDNNQDFVEFNNEAQESLVRVQSIFTKLIGSYKILTKEEEQKLKDIITPIMQKYKNSLQQHLDSLSGESGMLTKKELLDAFTFMDIDFKPEEIDYVFLSLFKHSNNILQYPYSKLFEVFQPPPQPSNSSQKVTRASTQGRQQPRKKQDLKSIFKS